MEFGLIYYPFTLQEATDLERHLSNSVHLFKLLEPFAFIKKREASALAQHQQSAKPLTPK